MNDIESLLAEQQILKAIRGYLSAVDDHRWNDVAGFFADRITVDRSSIRASSLARTLWIHELVTEWCSRFEREAAYQHVVTDLVVRFVGDRAFCSGNCTEWHVTAHAAAKEGVLSQLGCRMEWQLGRSRQSYWVIEGVRSAYAWEGAGPCVVSRN